MAFFSTLIAALLLSLPVALISTATAYTTMRSSSVEVIDPAGDSFYLQARMIAAANTVELFIANEVEARLSASTDTSEKECLIMCKEVYGSAVEELKKAVESASEGDFLKVNTGVGDFVTDIDTCNECYGGFRRFDEWAKDVGRVCHARIVKYVH